MLVVVVLGAPGRCVVLLFGGTLVLVLFPVLDVSDASRDEASVDVMGAKTPKLPLAELSVPLSEKKWMVPVSLDAHNTVDISLNARQ